MLLFENPISQTKVRKDVYAYRYLNGLILIEKERYYFYSLTKAIKIWRNKNPKK